MQKRTFLKLLLSIPFVGKAVAAIRAPRLKVRPSASDIAKLTMDVRNGEFDGLTPFKKVRPTGQPHPAVLWAAAVQVAQDPEIAVIGDERLAKALGQYVKTKDRDERSHFGPEMLS